MYLSKVILDAVGRGRFRAPATATEFEFMSVEFFWRAILPHKNLVIISINLVVWRKTWRLRDLFPLFERIIGKQPLVPVSTVVAELVTFDPLSR